MKKIFFVIILFFLFSCSTNQRKAVSENETQKPAVSQLIQEMDTDKDGSLSKAEVKGPLADDFSNIDADMDGFLTVKELENAPGPNREKQSQIKVNQADINGEIKTVSVNQAYFIAENIIGEIRQEKINLSGLETSCYVIKTHSQATEHKMGPWCPTHIEDGMDKAGIWFNAGKVYDISGHFIANLDEFYSDDKWKVYREDGSIRVTDTKEGCIAAAKPNVEEAYNNYCVECLPAYFKDQVTTYVIPVKPQYLNVTQHLGHGGLGLAFNGVKFDPPAPTELILAAHTIAPLDDHGGHVNPHGGYHYHAVTGGTKEIEQTDYHAPIIGYAIDGFGIYALKDKAGNLPIGLDECGGHQDDIRGYHYHAGEPGGNQIIKCLHGLPGYTEVAE
ncbi:hypothetical protein DNU06_05475 [Putridiphycobacter roseus]|uniref:EF-hand domain-containing protein n=1 Tax=Putridiphycobacter roseus TaxID=2219161 RepID=A0A2W1N1E3_9FLAO|nr:YHYH protein [Putridiphycobacter roseus]PZE18067.1 hypothetical protein DNU06_05475 [Putridiphycobacter roseus]